MSEDSEQKSSEIKPRVKGNLSESPNNKQSKLQAPFCVKVWRGTWLSLLQLLLGTTIGEIILTRQRSQAPGLSVTETHPETSSNRRNQSSISCSGSNFYQFFPSSYCMWHKSQLQYFTGVVPVRVNFTSAKTHLRLSPKVHWKHEKHITDLGIVRNACFDSYLRMA